MNTIPRWFPIVLTLLVLCAARPTGAGIHRSPAEFFAPEVPIASRLTGELTRGSRLVQEFVPIHNQLRSVGIHLVALNRPNTGTLTIDLREKGGAAPIHRWKLDVATIHGEPIHDLRFQRQPDSKGKTYVLTIESPDGAPGSSLFLWLDRLFDGDPTATYTFDGKSLQGRIVLVPTFGPNPWLKAAPYLLGIPGALLAAAWVYVRPARLATPVKVVLAAACLAPAVFVVLMIQRGAVTAPFYDHIALGQKYIIPYYDGHVTYLSLFGPHNHTRPFCYRIVYFLNALLTDWDLRSEYVFHTASYPLALTVYGWALFSALGRKFSVTYFAALAAVSIFLFSPVGQNNHWWSMMSQLTLANLFIAFALAALTARGDRWSGQVLAAIGCWLATYTITNGLFAFAACAAVTQFLRRPVWVPNRFTYFWVANVLVCAVLYFPGVPETAAGAHHGSPLDLLKFSLVYLGLPLSGMIRYPYTGPFHVPTEILVPAVTGACLLLFAAASAAWHRDLIVRRTPAAMFFVGCAVFAVLSALGTAWGRAGDALVGGVPSANSSRYSIYASYLVIGLIVFWCGALKEAYAAVPAVPGIRPPFRVRALRAALAAAFVTLLPLAYRTYRDSIPVYDAAHVFNKMVWHAYEHAESADDRLIYPDVTVAREFKRNLYRLRLGPYNTRD